ncbi:ROK family transcriptional regulator [Pseudonocardia sp. TRM90224]|uniref:ROK family transcriptional regulator n=1 Tax=Pseudonocardia sp. TRM90224 TaxID=2812678 RepID=UPI001E574490|nr:ROK family transcriptional regulator [Pseudonocardia sp. TRM90224]
MTGAVSSSRTARDANARVVLDHLWDSPEPLTGTDLMVATGLSRATVHDVCEELIDLGWAREAENQRVHGEYRKGRPARRYGFDPHAGTVLGIDAGEHRVRVRLTDLRGTLLAAESRSTACTLPTPELRLDIIREAVRHVVDEAGAPRVLAAVVGVPAPVDSDGRVSYHGHWYWELVNPDVAGHLSSAFGWPAIVDNDANLAALGEGWQGHGRGLRNHITLLAGERLGAGIVHDGQLLRGARGGAGEMHYLTLVEGVGGPAGIGELAREWAREALAAPGAESSLQAVDAVESEAVFAAAAAGDELAAAVIDRIGVRMAKVVATLASIVDTEQVVLAGRVAESAQPIADRIAHDLPHYLAAPYPQVRTSELGGDVVAIGAVKRALDHVRAGALGIALR